MKQYYTFSELLDSCGVVTSRHHVPDLTWETLTYQHMVDYFYESGGDKDMKVAMTRLASLLKYRTAIDGEIFIGELWYDKDDFYGISSEDFEDLMINHINTTFEFETYLVYAVTSIELSEEYHEGLEFDGYRVTAYGSRIEDEAWLFEIENIFNTFFL